MRQVYLDTGLCQGRLDAMERFSFATDPTGDLGALLVPGTSGGEVTVGDLDVHVAFGDPPIFEARFERSMLAEARRQPDLLTATRGIHGRRGRWLVNRSGANLVTLRFVAPVQAAFRMGSRQLPSPRSALGRLLARWVLRDRVLSVRELTLSLDAPDAFIASLR